ncbi:MAG: 6-bladed beta-propeller [Prevotellaceae bacterium]|nr:6-bladed beta-propeller [Prevotellaceae bacterium]
MKKILFFIIITNMIVFSSCNSNRKTNKGVIFNIQEVDKVFSKDALEGQGIIALSNDCNASFEKVDNIQYYDNNILIRDSKDQLFLFSNDGAFISNSKKIHGKGKGEYYLCLAYSLNQYSNKIEILVPDGIMFYDVKFNFIKKVKFNNTDYNSSLFNYICDLSEDKHLLLCPNEDGEPKIYIYDSSIEKIVHSAPCPSEYKELTMQRQCLSDTDFIAFPCLNYTFYSINNKNYNVKPEFTLDFGNKNLLKAEYDNINGIDNKQLFLFECKQSLPLRAFKSNDKVAVLVKEGPLRKDFITLLLDLKTKKHKIILGTDEKKFPIWDYFKNNTFYTCLTGEELKEYVDTTLLDQKSKRIFTSSSDSPNYYILTQKIK